ncbi:NAD-dependent epimerase/dehydratase family protein, partial [Marinobacter sp. 1Y8]
MNILVTGAAGFIGFHLIKALLQIQLPNNNNCIVGIDNINDYYDVSLKEDRLTLLNEISETKYFTFIKLDLA